jgi:chromosome segregation ATPase
MRSPLVTGLLHPLNLAMLGLTAFAGLVAAWWLFPLGALLWMVMVFAVSRDPSLRMTHEMHSREPLAQRFQHHFDRVERAHVSVFNSLASAPARARRVLRPIQHELQALTDQVYHLCQRVTSLENYRLVSESTSDLQADLEQIDVAIEKASDQLVKQQYQASRRALLDRMAKLGLVASQLDRIEAQLVALANELDGVVAEAIRLQAVGTSDAEQGVSELVDRLQEQSAQLALSGRETVEV